MEKLQITQSDQKIDMQLTGTDVNISKMMASAMAQDKELAAIILSAIPTYLDVTGRSRNLFCELIKRSIGANQQDIDFFNDHIKANGGKIV